MCFPWGQNVLTHKRTRLSYWRKWTPVQFVYSTVRLALPSAAFQAGFAGVYLFGWNPKTLPASLSWLLLHCTYLNPASKPLMSLESKPSCVGRPTSRARLPVSSLEPYYTYWQGYSWADGDFLWSYPSTHVGCVVLLLAGTMLCSVQQANGFGVGRCSS